MQAHNMFNTKLCEVLGLDSTKVQSMIVEATGDETTVVVTWMPDLDVDQLDAWSETYVITEKVDDVVIE